MDYATLVALRRQHPAWRLLAAEHAPLVTSFLFHAFIRANVRVLAQDELAAKLEDFLYHLRETLGESAYPKPARQYLDDWTTDERSWLRKFYPPGQDEAHFDLTPATENVIEWLGSLQKRQFVGAESRLMTIFDLLHQMVEGAETDPQQRIADLERRKTALDAEIAQVRAGRMALMDATALKERFLQVESTARSLLADFREVEQNFRSLDRVVRERIAL